MLSFVGPVVGLAGMGRRQVVQVGGRPRREVEEAGLVKALLEAVGDVGVLVDHLVGVHVLAALAGDLSVQSSLCRDSLHHL